MKATSHAPKEKRRPQGRLFTLDSAYETVPTDFYSRGRMAPVSPV